MIDFTGTTTKDLLDTRLAGLDWLTHCSELAALRTKTSPSDRAEESSRWRSDGG